MTEIELPIFPLGIVLFPGALQLLHIFEPRYRQMLSDCLEGERKFGISYVPRGADETDALSPGCVGCVAAIQTVQPLPDGRSNLLALGEVRYRSKRQLFRDRSYYSALVETFGDDPDPTEEVNVATVTARKRFTQLKQLNQPPGQPSSEPLELAYDSELLSFQIAAALGLDSTAAQSLLEQTSTATRLEALNHLMSRLMRESTARHAVQAIARKNGKGDRNRVSLSP